MQHAAGDNGKGDNAAQRRGYRFLTSWFERLAVASHPLQPDSFILGSAADTAAATAVIRVHSCLPRRSLAKEGEFVVKVR